MNITFFESAFIVIKTDQQSNNSVSDRFTTYDEALVAQTKHRRDPLVANAQIYEEIVIRRPVIR